MRSSSSREDREYLEALLEQGSGLLRSIRVAQGRLAEVTGEGKGPEGLARVVTDRRGRVERITLDPRAMRMKRELLAGEILAAIQSAQRDAEERSAGILSEVQPRPGAVVPPLDETVVQERLEQILHDL
ncbi:YbaB/EbfC family nucleoid-associated protein [Nonomuraea rhizosphaerae]|uniref:YbaB/EbfC family nucleoid-associated protein n=1 Tax=Nonomuraea rhizosphaerae TaxID=2665663 RepID=UPI001C5D3AF7|nr:YbaB/EbfC family nucleoid-associated protein [Nonomuraea rhizosphaerae]